MEAFVPFPKVPRFNRELVVTEKINGTNGQVFITDQTFENPPLASVRYLDTHAHVYAGSRNRLIYPDQDNYGFARWVQDNAVALIGDLGFGRHFGEWYGYGIQRNPYELEYREFALFNADRWADEEASFTTDGLTVVPVLLRGQASYVLPEVNRYLNNVRAGVFFDRYIEGVMIYHTASGHMYKMTVHNDDQPKGKGEQ